MLLEFDESGDLFGDRHLPEITVAYCSGADICRPMVHGASDGGRGQNVSASASISGDDARMALAYASVSK